MLIPRPLQPDDLIVNMIRPLPTQPQLFLSNASVIEDGFKNLTGLLFATFFTTNVSKDDTIKANTQPVLLLNKKLKEYRYLFSDLTLKGEFTRSYGIGFIMLFKRKNEAVCIANISSPYITPQPILSVLYADPYPYLSIAVFLAGYLLLFILAFACCWRTQLVDKKFLCCTLCGKNYSDIYGLGILCVLIFRRFVKSKNFYCGVCRLFSHISSFPLCFITY